MSESSYKPLSGVRVVITRPAGQGRGLARRARALGGDPLLLPGLSLRAIADPACARMALEQARDGALMIFTSPAAVRFAAGLALLRGKARVAAVGRGTARALQRHGVREVLVPQSEQNSTGLLAHPALSQVRGLAVAVVGADGGRGVLQRQLRERGARVCDVHVYRRMPARLDRRHRQALARLHPPACVLLSSAAALQSLQAALSGADWGRLTACVAVVSSRRLERVAREAGFERRALARSALAADLLDQAVRAMESGNRHDDRPRIGIA